MIGYWSSRDSNSTAGTADTAGITSPQYYYYTPELETYPGTLRKKLEMSRDWVEAPSVVSPVGIVQRGLVMLNRKQAVEWSGRNFKK